MKTIEKHEMEPMPEQTIKMRGLMIGDTIVGIKNQVLGLRGEDDQIYIIAIVDTDQPEQDRTIRIRSEGDDCADVSAIDCIGCYDGKYVFAI